MQLVYDTLQLCGLGHLLPGLAAQILLVDNVVDDWTATIIFWDLPVDTHALSSDFINREAARWAGLVCKDVNPETL